MCYGYNFLFPTSQLVTSSDDGVVGLTMGSSSLGGRGELKPFCSCWHLGCGAGGGGKLQCGAGNTGVATTVTKGWEPKLQRVWKSSQSGPAGTS